MQGKKQIRLAKKQERARLSLEDVQEQSNRICNQICDAPVFKAATTILVYSPIGNEVDTGLIVQIALENNKQVAYPSTDTTNGTMTFHTVNTLADLKPTKSGSFKLQEPVPDLRTLVLPDKNTLMIVPGLAFDKKFYRIGYGGGFYDKYLELYPILATIGVCYDFQLIPSAYPCHYDKPVCSIVTPTQRYG